jgi:hexosaminidase
MPALIPQPLTYQPRQGVFHLQAGSKIYISEPNAEILTLAGKLAAPLRRATGFDLPILTGAGIGGEGIFIRREKTLSQPESYRVQVTPQQIILEAPTCAGLFYATQTLLQMLPTEVEASTPQNIPWQVDCCTLEDEPRYPWRGMMLDVARHLFSVETVKRLLQLLARYKMNTLHLHLSDDQGWRIMVEALPRLALHGGKSAVNGDPGGYYTQAEYREIVSFAQEHYINIVPEIDMPGHTNAALASYPDLNPDGIAPSLYTGIRVGFSSLAAQQENTYGFIEAVVREVAALTPGAYFHFGGDETHATSGEDYARFVERVQDIILAQGKIPIGWEEIGKTRLAAPTLAQFWWNEENIRLALAQGNKIIFSPARKTYMDIKYEPHSPLGLLWTETCTEVQDAYDWDPARFLEDVPAEAILGIEAPLWTETVSVPNHLDFMTFPRLCGYAEIGWSRPEGRSWEDYRLRLAKHGARLQRLGVQFYRSPQVDWEG